MEILSSLLTILIIVLLGIFSRKSGIFKAEHAKTLSSFVYYFGLPALFFVKITNLDLYSLEIGLVLGTILPTILLLGLLLVLKWIKVMSQDTYILSSLSISLGSYAFFGVAFFETFQDGRWLELSILAASLLGVVGIISTLSLLEYASKKDQSRGFLVKIFTNPLIISILLGAIFSLAGIQLGAVNFALNLVGQTASALAIFVLGMFIYDRFTAEIIKPSLFYSLFRIIGLPLIAWITIRIILPGSTDLNQFLMLENGMPAAIALVVFAERYDYKVTETAGIVSLTSIFSFIGLTAIYYLSQFIF
jgi:predicted permease